MIEFVLKVIIAAPNRRQINSSSLVFQTPVTVSQSHV